MEDNEEDKEFFKFTINSGEDSSFAIPCKNDKAYKGTSNTTENKTYNLIIDWGDGSELEEKTITSESTSEIPHTYSKENTNYQITIKPKDKTELGWMKGFGFGPSENQNKEKMISLDSPITKNAWFDEGDNSYLGYFIFYKCINLIMGTEFNLPQNKDITEVGDNFCHSMLHNCINLQMNEIFQLPQGIIEVGEDFCFSMLNDCSSLKMNNIFQLPQGITEIDSGFCQYIFYRCKSITAGVQKFFGDLKLSQKELNKSSVFSYAFNNCSSIIEEISPNTIPQLEILPTRRNSCFSSCPSEMIKNCPYNWR